MLDGEEIQIILENRFLDEIYQKVLDIIDEMEQGDWADRFELLADYVLLDEIEDMDVASWDEEEEEGSAVVSGTLELTARLDAYAHWDGEEILMESAGFPMEFAFEFSIVKEEVGNFYLKYIG